MKTIEVPCLAGDRGYLKYGEFNCWFTVKRLDIYKHDIRIMLEMDSGDKRQYFLSSINNIYYE